MDIVKKFWLKVSVVAIPDYLLEFLVQYLLEMALG